MAGSVFDHVGGKNFDHVVIIDESGNGRNVENPIPISLPDLQVADLKLVNLENNPTSKIDELHVVSSSIGVSISRKNQDNLKVFSKIGLNEDVDNLEETLWSVGGTYVWPSSGQRMEVVSSSINDTLLGSGARSVRIIYLDSNFVEHQETVNLDGLSPVETESSDIYRVNFLWVSEAGSSGKAEGNIDVRSVLGSPIYSRIIPGLTRARNIPFTVPAGKVLYISQMTYSTGSSKGGVFVRFTLRANYDEFEDRLSDVFYPYSDIGLDSNTLSITYSIPLRFVEGVDLIVSATGDANNVDASCECQYRGALETL